MADQESKKPSARDPRAAMPQRTRLTNPAELPKEFRPLAKLEPITPPKAEPVAPEPVVPEPVAPEPAAAAPVAPEPVAPEPAAAAPVAEREAEREARPAVPAPFRPIPAAPTAPPVPGVRRPLPRSATRASTITRAPAPRTTPPPPTETTPAPSGSSNARRRVVAGVISLVVVVALGAAVLQWTQGRGPDDAAASTRTDNATIALDSPLLLVEDSEYVETKVLDNGDLIVTHWIQSSAPLDRLTVTVPVRPGLREQDVEVKDLVVAADGARVEFPDTASGSAWIGTLADAQSLYVQYELSGVLQLSDSAEGRALATMTSLVVDVGRDLVAKTQAFPGAQVLTLACLPPGAQAMPRPCGTLDADTWRVVSDPDHVQDTVIGQFDLSAG